MYRWWLPALYLAGLTLVAPAGAVIRAVTREDVASAKPATTVDDKKLKKICSIDQYGSEAGAALQAAWEACKTGGLIVIPAGTHTMSTTVAMSNGAGVAIQFDGVLDVHNSENCPAITISNVEDLEVFGTGAGGMQGNGYLRRKNADTAGTTKQHLLDISHCAKLSVHDLSFADAQYFVLAVFNVKDAEIYNLAITQPNIGGVDSVDVSGERIWVHDIEATGMDECVTVKSPSSTILIEQLYCNRSGGCAIGSLRERAQVDSITYRNVYTWAGNQQMMIKAHGGSGTLTNVVLENFYGRDTAYQFKLDLEWSNIHRISGDGIAVSDILVKDWHGVVESSNKRGSPTCSNIQIESAHFEDENGNVNSNLHCENARGTGACLSAAARHRRSLDRVQKRAEFSVAQPKQMPKISADLSEGFDRFAAIPLPKIPTEFFPGLAPIKAPVSASSAVKSHNLFSPPSADSNVTSTTVRPTNTTGPTPTGTAPPSFYSFPIPTPTPTPTPSLLDSLEEGKKHKVSHISVAPDAQAYKEPATLTVDTSTTPVPEPTVFISEPISFLRYPHGTD